MAEKSSHLQITYWGEDSPLFLLDKSDYSYYASYEKGGGAVAEPKTVLTIREWPLDLHRQMRSEAAIRGITLREAIMEACRLWLRTKRKGG